MMRFGFGAGRQTLLFAVLARCQSSSLILSPMSYWVRSFSQSEKSRAI